LIQPVVLISRYKFSSTSSRNVMTRMKSENDIAHYSVIGYLETWCSRIGSICFIILQSVSLPTEESIISMYLHIFRNQIFTRTSCPTAHTTHSTRVQQFLNITPIPFKLILLYHWKPKFVKPLTHRFEYS